MPKVRLTSRPDLVQERSDKELVDLRRWGLVLEEVTPEPEPVPAPKPEPEVSEEVSSSEQQPAKSPKRRRKAADKDSVDEAEVGGPSDEAAAI